ncbi:MAG: LysR family transcriptional regulator [Clostridiales bacterium]|nr:LysR family transcriptional regulator [Clostridiales bacterium]
MELSETCSYQDASERLYITNSTLSKHIQKMEAELGVPSLSVPHEKLL